MGSSREHLEQVCARSLTAQARVTPPPPSRVGLSVARTDEPAGCALRGCAWPDAVRDAGGHASAKRQSAF
jgi:hypothetical protein